MLDMMHGESSKYAELFTIRSDSVAFIYPNKPTKGKDQIKSIDVPYDQIRLNYDQIRLKLNKRQTTKAAQISLVKTKLFIKVFCHLIHIKCGE